MKKAITVVLYGCALTLLLSLGFWQVDRAQQKATLLTLAAGKDKEPRLVRQAPADWVALNYQPVRLQGQWLPAQSFLLDNRVYQRQVGYELLTPFRLADGSLLMVNRGWQAKASVSTELTEDNDSVSGVIYAPTLGYVIGEAITADSNWPMVSLYLDLEAFAAQLGQPLQPVVLVADKADGNALVRIWKPVVSGPERHWGYALQWFGLALVLMIFGVIWARKLRSK